MFAPASRLASLCENAISDVTAVDARTIRESGEEVLTVSLEALGLSGVRRFGSVRSCVRLGDRWREYR